MHQVLYLECPLRKVPMYVHRQPNIAKYLLYTAKLNLGSFHDFHSIVNIFLQILLNKIFYRFHPRHDDKALGNCESFPVIGHLHTNHESFSTQKFCSIRYVGMHAYSYMTGEDKCL